jgi:hypothetical protein
MTTLLSFCWRAYDFTLYFYPADLREGFGSEMSEVFRQQTLHAWTERRWGMLLAVIWYAARELFTEALPARASSPAVVAGASSLVCTSATFWCLLWALGNPLAVKAFGDRLNQALRSGSSAAPVSRAHRAGQTIVFCRVPCSGRVEGPDRPPKPMVRTTGEVARHRQ